MKKIVVLSDTHGNYSVIEKLLPIINESDYVFHLGDFERDIELFSRSIISEIYSVSGNCDGGSSEQIVEVEGVKILLTHGNKYNVKTSLTSLLFRAKELGVDAVFYGHTHVPDIQSVDGIYLINPGCATRFSGNSYCYTVIHNKKVTSTIVYIG